ncbi:MAG: heparinase II/III-family protein [Bryobacteraceae bacterium]|nr:heparinase II/III-family protein [Bryobacteraceae bacterium]
MAPITRRAFAGSPLLVLAQTAPAPPPRRLLESRIPADLLRRAVLAPAEWKPWPKAEEREPWQALPSELRAAIVAAAEQHLGRPWPSLTASLFLEYARNGNRSKYESVRRARRDRLTLAALAECVEGRGRFLDEVLDGIWLTCEESFWGVPAHIGAQKAGNTLPDMSEPIVDLFAAETSATLAWIVYLLGAQLEKLSKLVRPRVHAEIRRRILDPCLTRDDFWWLGFGGTRAVNNWNPWINSNWLSSVLLAEPGAEQRTAALAKIVRSLDRFLDAYHEDGGCDEGPGYWSRAAASLFDCLDLLHSASAGAINAYGVPLVREMGAYIYRAHIAGPWYLNFADASARVRPDAVLVWRYGQSVQDPRMEAFGAWLAAQETDPLALAVHESMWRSLQSLFHYRGIRAASASARPPLAADVILPGTQVFAARLREGSDRGFYVAAQGGHNAESHNHNDVGNFIVFCDGEPVLIDIGVETYTALTFSPRRYEIWTMQSAWHNCPTINGVMQAAGQEYEARNFRAEPGRVSMEIQAAYPAGSGCRRWRRGLELDRAANRVLLHDSFELERRESVEWHFITHRAPQPAGPGRVLLDRRWLLAFDPSLELHVDEHSSEDPRLRPVWGPVVRRLRLRLAAPPARGEYTFSVGLA